MSVIKVENLSKIYDLGLVGTGTLSKDLNRTWAKLRGKPDPYATLVELNDRAVKSETNMVYALKDINFEVEQGEVLGIIGKNGAGKSTLLKLLSQITSPTTGDIKMKGRVASLLEVGTGMHPEMTAKENVYLNGSIMGMTRKEVSSKFDEIIDFAGIGKYVDTPIKRFSSGMKVRLGFAVAAFLEPEILIIDEVLAVGDAEFQKKAVGKMQDVSKQGGRTVLFVSHNMAAVKSLCTRGLVLENGMIAFEGNTDESVDFYLKMGNESGAGYLRHFGEDEFKNLDFMINSIGVKAKDKDYGTPILRTDEIHICINFNCIRSSNLVGIGVRFKDEQGNFIFVSSSNIELKNISGTNNLKLIIPHTFFNEGVFFIDIQANDGRKIIFRQEDVISLTVLQESKELGTWMGKSKGSIKPNFDWEISK